MTGTKFGNWILGPEVGRGPVGVVYRATSAEGTGQSAAVKVITHDIARDPAFQSRFQAEVLALRRLTHPNIAAYFDSGVQSGIPFVAREWIDGTDLGTVIRQRVKTADGPDWRNDFLSAAVQLARALKHGHRRSVLHRALKPSNVIVMADGVIKLTDFGLAKAFALSPIALPAEPWGTAAFLAPEHFTGKPLTRRSDLYSLGGVLYALLAGRPPYAATTTAEFMHKHCYVLPDRPANFVTKLPQEIDELICSLLSKDPNRRPASAIAVLEECDRIRGKLERKGEWVAWPADPGDTALHEPLSETTAAEIDGDEATADATRNRPLLARPWVVIPAFVLVLVALLYLLLRPGPGPDELYARAEPLLASGELADLDRAWDDYLEPLSRKYPDRYVDEIRALRLRRTALREFHRASDVGQRATYASETERVHALGLALLRTGDTGGARRLFEVAVLIADAERIDRGRELARIALRECETRFGSVPPADRTFAVTQALRSAMNLQNSGTAVAGLFQSLESYVQGDAELLKRVRDAAKSPR